MAGDWIKMRIDLQTHPKVVRILSATGADKFRVIGGLHAVWSVFDTHCEDGKLHGYTLETLDHIIGWSGFSASMRDVGWLDDAEHGCLKMPEFQEHNGKSGKRRAEDQKRKRTSRSCPQSVRKVSQEEQDEKRTREEKRRSKPPYPPQAGGVCSDAFDRFWQAYPRKVSKGQAEKAFAKLNPDEHLLGDILAAVQRAKTREQWQREGGKFIPHPATWLNAKGWEDEDGYVADWRETSIFAGVQ